MNREDEDAWESRDEGRSERGVWACDLHQTQQELPYEVQDGLSIWKNWAAFWSGCCWVPHSNVPRRFDLDRAKTVIGLNWSGSVLE